MTNRMQEWLARAAAELGLKIVIGYVSKLSDGREVETQALLPDLGSKLGTLVFDSAVGLDKETRSALRAQGYAISSFAEPSLNEEFDVSNYVEMFTDWGWASSSDTKPMWMDENAV